MTGSERRDKRENPPDSSITHLFFKGFDCKRSHTAPSEYFRFQFKKLAGLPAGFLFAPREEPQINADERRSIGKEMK